MSDQSQPKQNACFSESAWLDHVRGLTQGDVATAMQDHLANGCLECGAKFRLWSKTYSSARQAADYEPPEAVVQAAKSAFTVSRRLPFFESLAVAASRVFDTFLEPLPAGIRAIASSGRHIVHQCNGIVVDIKVDDEAGAFACLTGQVLVQNGKPEETAGTLAFLVSGPNRLVGQTSANEVGEFQIDLEYAPNLKLYLQLPAGNLIAVVLPDDVFKATP